MIKDIGIKDISIGELPANRLYLGDILIWERKPKIPMDYILRYDFDGDTVDKSLNGLNGIQTGAMSFQAGRKAGTQCADFVNGCVYTSSALPINSDKVSISFWLNIRNDFTSCVMELGSNMGYSGLGLFFSDTVLNSLQLGGSLDAGYYFRHTHRYSLNNWVHFVGTLDNSQTSENTGFIYINGSDATEFNGYNNDNSTRFINDRLFIGQRFAAHWPLDGQLQDLRIYNRILNADERLQLFNE